MATERPPSTEFPPEWRAALAARESEVESRLRSLEERGRELEGRVRELAARRAELEQGLAGQRKIAERLQERREELDSGRRSWSWVRGSAGRGRAGTADDRGRRGPGPGAGRAARASSRPWEQTLHTQTIELERTRKATADAEAQAAGRREALDRAARAVAEQAGRLAARETRPGGSRDRRWERDRGRRAAPLEARIGDAGAQSARAGAAHDRARPCAVGVGPRGRARFASGRRRRARGTRGGTRHRARQAVRNVRAKGRGRFRARSWSRRASDRSVRIGSERRRRPRPHWTSCVAS